MAVVRDDDERAARIDMLLEELRLNTEDLHELATQAKRRAQAQRTVARANGDAARAGRDKVHTPTK